jgi:glycosyltransferase involved in cell wall biosynthesis
VTDGFVPHIRAHRAKGPIAVIKNGVDLSRFASDPAAADAFRAQHGLTGKFVASYVGTHGMAHGLQAVIAAAERLRDRNDIAFLMVGGGAQRETIKTIRDTKGLTNIVMLDQLPKAAMPAVWGASDAALVLLKRVDTFKTVIPSKMFEAMALGVPMILGVEGEAKALMEEGSAGIAITPEDDAELATAILRLADDRALGRQIGASAQAFVRAQFDREKLAHAYLAEFEALRR